MLSVSGIYNTYGYQILFYGAIGLIVVVFIYNLITGKKGTYTNHTKFIKQLLQKQGINSGSNTSRRKQGSSRGEAECRRVMEMLTGKPFNKQRPSFLRNDVTNSRLELDCFNDDLKLAVEYNGEQHYRYTPYFHSSRAAFQNGQYRDKLKDSLCKQHGVRLIVVPYTVENGMIESYLRDQLGL